MALQSYTVNPTVDTALYASGDRVSADVIQLPKILPSEKATIELKHVQVRAESGNTIPLSIYFFSEDPAEPTADNTALTLANASVEKLIGKAQITGADYTLGAARAFGGSTYSDFMRGEDVAGDEGKDVYLVLEADGGFTFSATTGLQLTIVFEVSP
jgi:hypothetical protein